MITIPVGKFKTEPAPHQLEGVRFCVDRQYAAIFDEQGTGKTKQIIDVGCTLWDANREIDTVVMITPASVKANYTNTEFGEIKNHGWVPGLISEYYSYNDSILSPDVVREKGRLYWIITNYEFITKQDRLDYLMAEMKRRKVMLVADESSYIKTWNSGRTQSCNALGRWAKRKYILNGTPVSQSHMDLFGQLRFLSPHILGYTNFFSFRKRYAKMGGWQQKQVVGIENEEELNAKIKPYVIRRTKEDAKLGLPEKSYNVQEVALTPRTWKHYLEIKNEMVSEFDPNLVSQSLHAITKVIRLAQVTGGFIGGLQPASYDLLDDPMNATYVVESGPKTIQVGNEKLQAFKQWLELQLQNNHRFRAIIWCRFQAEQQMLAEAFSQKLTCYRIYGGQRKEEREQHILGFTRLNADKPALLLGQPQAGGWGLNLQHLAYNAFYYSNDYNLLTRLQSEDRIHRRGQEFRCIYTDLLATGPNGQKTIDHVIYRALRRKEDFARWTTDKWRDEILAA